jgi:nitrous oxidase accessory protein NosD
MMVTVSPSGNTTAAVTYTPIFTYTVSGSAVSNFTWSSIPATYTDLIIVTGMISSSGGNGMGVQFNSDTGSNYSYARIIGSGASGSGDNTSGAANISIYGSEPSSFTATVFSNAEIYIPNYAGSNYKSTLINSVLENNASTSYVTFVAGLWSSTSAINRVTLSTSLLFTQYSTASLYGILKY